MVLNISIFLLFISGRKQIQTSIRLDAAHSLVAIRRRIEIRSPPSNEISKDLHGRIDRLPRLRHSRLSVFAFRKIRRLQRSDARSDEQSQHSSRSGFLKEKKMFERIKLFVTDTGKNVIFVFRFVLPHQINQIYTRAKLKQ